MTTETIDAPAAAPAAPAADTRPSNDPRQFDSIGDAVAELERRDAARRAAARAEKQAKAEQAFSDMEDERNADLGRRRAVQDDDADEGDDDEDSPKSRRASERDEDDGEDDAEIEALDDTSDDDADEATDDEDDDEQPRKVVRLDGKEIEIPKGTPRALVETVTKLADDLKADYTRKTQEAAEVRRIAAERAQAIEAQLQQVQRAQQAVVAMANQLIGSPPPLELAQTDIGSYTIQKELYEQRMRQLQALGAHSQQIEAAQRQQMEAAQQEALREEAQKFIEKLPEMAKPEKRKAFLDAAIRTAEASGFAPEDVAGVADHRMLHLLNRLVVAERKVAAYEKASGDVRSKLDAVPPRVLRSGTQPDPNSVRSERKTKAKQAFLRSGKTMADVRRYLAATE